METMAFNSSCGSPAIPWCIQGKLWGTVELLCQEIVQPLSRGIWTDGCKYFISSHKTIILLQLTIILVATSLCCFLLRPLRLPFISQIIAGLLVGLLLGGDEQSMFFIPPVVYILRTFSFIGFHLHAFMLGVETNRTAVRNISKKAVFVGFSGLILSLGLAFAAYASVKVPYDDRKGENHRGDSMLIMFNATYFFMVTCSHLNDLGISNSDLGNLAAGATLVMDIFGMVASFIATNVVIPVLQRNMYYYRKPLVVLAYYVLVFFFFRPLIKYIVSLTPEGRPMKQTHFLLIICSVLMMAFFGEVVDERFSTFLFAFTLPEEPLGSVLSERLDIFNSSIFFPIFCAMHGMKAKVKSLNRGSYNPEIILLGGYIGKFFGTFIAAMLVGLVFTHAISLALIMSSKGLMDVAIIGVWGERVSLLDIEEYTVAIFHIVVFTGLLLPLVRFLYVPSRQYSTILRRSVIETCDNGTFNTLACIHDEESIPGIIRLLDICHPTPSNPLHVIVLQLIQLTGRASMPFMLPLDKVTSSSAFRSNLARCNRVVNAFLHFERENKGNTFLQHHIAVTPYAAMHNDICKLAYDKGTNLVILPFHVRWTSDGKVEHSNMTIREVNARVLDKAPCSVGQFIDRGLIRSSSSSYTAASSQKQMISDNDRLFRIAVLFAGGADDHEALAYSRVLAKHPNVRLIVVWLKGPQDDENNGLDYDVMNEFRQSCHGNDSISFREVVVNDGAEMTQVVVAMKDVVDLVMVGKHHDDNCSAVFGLTNTWGEYPELGIIGDVLASPEFRFSVLVVQQEPQSSHSNEKIDIDMFE